MKCGVSTSCFYPELTEKAFQYLVEHGIEVLEIFSNCRLELTPEFLRPLQQLANVYGAQISSLHPYTSAEEGRMFFGQYPRRLEEAREFYKHYYEACNLVGADGLVFHGAWYTQMDDGEYIERLAMLHEDARTVGVALCLENVWRFRSQSVLLIKEICKAIPDFKFVLDTKQAILSGYRPQDMLRAMGGNNLHHIHISDSNESESCMVPGEGDFDFPAFLADLKEAGFDGPLILELYRDNYSSEFQLIEGCQRINSFLE